MPQTGGYNYVFSAGDGIAPFVGFLAEREAAASRSASWLILGNRRRYREFLNADRLNNWLRDGVLWRLDTAFSRDEHDGAHVQDRLIERSQDVWVWLTWRDAIRYVCGRKSTLGRALKETLCSIAATQRGLSGPAPIRQV
jgi:sulfite reductase (NADPH) flavoprotein alpha-component